MEDNDGEYACRGMENIEGTRCTEAINTQYGEENVVVAIVVGGCC